MTTPASNRSPNPRRPGSLQPDNKQREENVNQLAGIYERYSLTEEQFQTTVREVVGNQLADYAVGSQLLSEEMLSRIEQATAQVTPPSTEQSTTPSDDSGIRFGYVDQDPSYGAWKRKKAERWIERLYQTAQQKGVEEPAIPEEFYKGMALYTAYASWQAGDRLPIPMEAHKDKPLAYYECAQQYTTSEGLGLTIFIPKGGKPNSYPPLILFRGTRWGKGQRAIVDIANLVDDFAKSVGNKSFKASREQIATILRDTADTHGSVTILGHSLGGTVAQRVIADNLTETISQEKGKQSVIGQAFLYNAPGVGEKTAAIFKDKRDQLAQQGIRSPDIVDIYHARDLVHLGGGAHVCTRRIKIGAFMLSLTAIFKAHYFGKSPPTELRRHQFSLPKKIHILSRIIERIRRIARFLFKRIIGHRIRSNEVHIFMDAVTHRKQKNLPTDLE